MVTEHFDTIFGKKTPKTIVEYNSTKAAGMLRLARERLMLQVSGFVFYDVCDTVLLKKLVLDRIFAQTILYADSMS